MGLYELARRALDLFDLLGSSDDVRVTKDSALPCVSLDAPVPSQVVWVLPRCKILVENRACDRH